MKTFKEFHNEKVINEIALALPAIPTLIGGAQVLKSLAISYLITKMGYDALTNENVAGAIKDIEDKTVPYIPPLTTASPEEIVDSVTPHITADGVSASGAAAESIGKALAITTENARHLLTFCSGNGIPPASLCLILGLSVVLLGTGTYQFIKRRKNRKDKDGGKPQPGNEPSKFIQLLKKAVKVLYKALKLAGKMAIRAFVFLFMTLAAALAQGFSWLAFTIGAGVVALIRLIVDRFKKEDKEDEVKDLENFDLKSSQA